MQADDSESDEVIMLRVREGQIDQLSTLYKRYRTPLFNFFLRLTSERHLSEDLVQDVFFRIMKYRHSYRPRHSFRTWMYQIARNVRIQAWSHAAREPVMSAVQEQDNRPTADENSVRPDTQVILGQDLDQLKQSISRLPEASREVLILSRYQYLKYDEIASILQCSVGAVKMRVLRAMNELRQQFEYLSRKEVS